jgi:hypothetical protein
LRPREEEAQGNGGEKPAKKKSKVDPEINRLREIIAAKDIELNQLRKVEDDTLLIEAVISRVIELGRKEPLDVNGILSLAFPTTPITDQWCKEDVDAAYYWLVRIVRGNEEAQRIIVTTLGNENWPEG